MEQRTIPHTNIQVSKICLGSMNWGQQNTETQAHEQLDYATSNDINFIDTAEVYPIPPTAELQGTTERFIGTWLKKRGKRDDLVIATKIGSHFQSSYIATRDARNGLTRENILQAIDGSLERLQTDYVDLYQVHVPDRTANYFGIRGFEQLKEEDVPSIEETLSGLAEIVQSGKVRHIGISNETPWGTMEYLRISKKKGISTYCDYSKPIQPDQSYI
ncbi:MAG: aldo/keto reductase [Candidatus Kaiserbacteria bacterium]|nr:aldo/keto reductase [Candidatus Kaiserbacteria bacterium]